GGVEAGHDVAAGPPGYPGEFTDHSAEGVDLDLTCPRATTQFGVLRLLDTALTDAKIRQLKQRIPGQLGLGNRGDVTDHVRRCLAERVGSSEALFDRNAGQFWDGDLDARHLVPAQIAPDH